MREGARRIERDGAVWHLLSGPSGLRVRVGLEALDIRCMNKCSVGTLVLTRVGLAGVAEGRAAHAPGPDGRGLWSHLRRESKLPQQQREIHHRNIFTTFSLLQGRVRLG